MKDVAVREVGLAVTPYGASVHRALFSLLDAIGGKMAVADVDELTQLVFTAVDILNCQVVILNCLNNNF